MYAADCYVLYINLKVIYPPLDECESFSIEVSRKGLIQIFIKFGLNDTSLGGSAARHFYFTQRLCVQT